MSDTEERVKNLLADLTELDIWADVDLLAYNLDGLSEAEVGEVIAGLQTGERAEPGDTIVTTQTEYGEFYQFESSDGERAQVDA